MNRSAKTFRVLSSLFVLMNLFALFLPFVQRELKYYGKDTWTGFDLLKCMFGNPLYGNESVSTLLVIGLILLPILLSLVAGIWGIVGNERQKGSIIFVLIVMIIYIISYVSYEAFCPGRGEADYAFSHGLGATLNLVFTGGASLMGIFAFFRTPKKVDVQTKTVIPQVEEIKQQQVEAKYNIILEENKKEKKTPYVPGEPRGVLVGLSGLYAGVEIPMNPGEDIMLGRAATNHLVFEGQQSVSRNHCKIRWNADRKVYSFLDYSSNGTFMNGSDECLPQNLEREMMPGTVIALGDEVNTFRLE